MEPQSIVHNCDCMEYMRTVPDKHFALAIVDPPYFSGPERREFYGCKVSKIGVQRLYTKTETWSVPNKEYFDELLGIDNIYAGSKVDIALNWIKDKDPAKCIMIGDTLHDLDVAKAMGVDCVLVAKGHQAKEILTENWDKVVDDIREVKL